VRLAQTGRRRDYETISKIYSHVFRVLPSLERELERNWV